MKKKAFGILFGFMLAVLLGNMQLANAASNNYEYVPTTISGKISLFNTKENQCVNVWNVYNSFGYKDLGVDELSGNAIYEQTNEKVYSQICNTCGAWLGTCFQQRLELPKEQYDTIGHTTKAHSKYLSCSGNHTGGNNRATRVFYKTEVYEVSASERVNLSN